MINGRALPSRAAADRRGRRTAVRHLLVVVPGIGGSALRGADGRPLWDIDPATGSRPLRAFRELCAPGHRLREADFDDGVRATRLMALPVPGLTRLLGGYRDLRTALFRHFDLVDGATYSEFPYDWRRPAAHNARLLARHVDERLTLLRRKHPDAEVILVAHSMGGLVAREYLERHDRHRSVRALLTLGTPFRGAVKALDFMVNGPRVAQLRFAFLAAEFARLPSLYELLPIYPFIRLGTSPQARLGGIEDVLDLLPDTGSAQARAAAEFLGRLNDSPRPEATRSFVGFGAPTLQQAVLSGSRLTVMRGNHLLPASHRTLDGDGTVALLSASPRSSEAKRLGSTPQNQTHSGLVTGRDALQALVIQIGDLVREGAILDRGRRPAPQTEPATGTKAPSAVPPIPPLPVTSALSLDVADWYDIDEPVSVPGRAPAHAGSTLWYRLGDRRPTELTVGDDGTFTVTPGPLTEGVRRLDLLTARQGHVLTTDVIEVVR